MGVRFEGLDLFLGLVFNCFSAGVIYGGGIRIVFVVK